MTITALRANQEPLLEIPEAVIERACAAHWRHMTWPWVVTWADLVEGEDHRVPRFRAKMQAALSALVLDGLAVLEEEG